MSNCVQNTAHNIFQDTADNEWSFCPQYPSTKKGIKRGGGATGVSSGTGGGAGGKTYGQKGYIGDKCYDEMMNRATYSDFLNKFKEKKSQRDKPYLPGDYPEMEHFYPTPPTPPTPSYPNLPGIPDAEDEFWPNPGRKPGFCDITCWDDRGKAPAFGCDDVIGWCYPAVATLGSDRQWEVEGPVDKILTGKKQKNLDLGGIEVYPDWTSIEPDGDVKCLEYKVKLTETIGDHKNICRQEFELCCKNICECPSSPVFAYGSNPATIARNATATITVNNGCGAFHWSVAGTGFSFAQSTTDTGTNVLSSDGTACGTAVIIVTDNCGDDVTGDVRCTAASEWVLVYTCGWFQDNDYYCTTTEGKLKYEVWGWCPYNTDWKTSTPCYGACNVPEPCVPPGDCSAGQYPNIPCDPSSGTPSCCDYGAGAWLFTSSYINRYEWQCS